MFSQSIRFGENTLQELQELEKGVDLQPDQVSTPGRSPGSKNSDSDIIEDSPQNHSSIHSYRERKAKQLSKSKTSTKKRKVKSRSSDELPSTSVRLINTDRSKSSLSQFFQSDYDFDDAIVKLLPSDSSSTSNDVCDDTKTEEKTVKNVGELDTIYESDMFSDWAVPTNPPFTQLKTTDHKESFVSTPSNGLETNDRKKDSVNCMWGDSCDFNDIELDFGDMDEQRNANGMMEVDEEIALGLDNVTFTQNLMDEAISENDPNLNGAVVGRVTSQTGEEETRADSQHLSNSRQLSTVNLNISESSFTLNYSSSTIDNDENPVTTPNSNKLSASQALKHLNSIDSWGLPSSIVREYHRKNIYNMFDWQRECLSNPKVLFHNSNLVYCAPTSAGKTLVSEILMIKNVLEKQRKVLVILPFVSVVREKMNYLQDLLTSTGIQVEGYFGGYSPRSFDTVDVAVCTIEKANSIVNKLLEQNQISTIGCIVVDEVHLISDPGRGYILELLLAKMLYVNHKVQCNIQVIAMSATLPNIKLLTDWLRAEYYHTDYRPVELREMIKINDTIFDNKMQPLRTVTDQEYKDLLKDPDNIGQMCVETILDGGSCIVFCPTKDRCEILAFHLAKFIHNIVYNCQQIDMRTKLREQIKPAVMEEAKAQLRNCEAGLDSRLAQTLTYGCAFHHAGLTSDEREIVENSFKAGSIRIIVSTSTLSSGVNLPARRVIIRSPSALYGKMMDPLTYKQMIGRAGRTGKDPIGESILICDDRSKKLGQDLIAAELKPLSSCLSTNNYEHFIRAILEITCSGMATTKDDLETFCQCTLLATEKPTEYKFKNEFAGNGLVSQEDNDVSDPIGACMRYLLQKEFIRLQLNGNTKENHFIATRLGSACLASSLAPKDGLDLYKELQKSRESFVVETDLHAIYLVTPLSICYKIHEIDYTYYINLWEKLSPAKRRVGDLVGVREATIVKALKGLKLNANELIILKRFYTALALEELVNEKSLNDVANKYKINRGDLQGLQQFTSTFAATVTTFCQKLNWTMLAKIIAEFKERLYFGVPHDLVDLMKIPNLNSQRARALYNEGIQTLSDLATSDLFTVEKILYNSLHFDTKQRDGENKWDADQRNKLRFLFVTGKPELTVHEAAEEIIESARQYLELEMGVGNIVWSKKSTESQSQNSQNKVSSNGVSSRIKIEASSQHSSRSTGLNRKRKLDTDDESNPPDYNGRMQFGKIRRTQSESESEGETENGLLVDEFNCVRIDSQQNANTDQSDIIDELIKYNEFNFVSVFRSLKFFEHFRKTIAITPIMSVAVGVNQLLRPAPIIGLSSLVKQVHNEAGNIDTYNCTFDDDKFIAVISLCLNDSDVYYLNLQNETNDDAAITFDMKIKFLVELFHLKQLTMVMYDAKEQCKVLLKCIPQLRSFTVQLRDPLVANWLIQPDVYGNLLSMVRQYAPNCGGIQDINGVENRNRMSISLNGRSTVSPLMRSSVESFASLHVMKKQMDKLNGTNSNMVTAFTDIEMPIQRVLLTMELAGFPVDDKKISELSIELANTLQSLENAMFRCHGRNFNIKSKTERAKVLGLKAVNGKVSTSKQVLEKLNHPIAKLLLQHKTTHSTLITIVQPFIRQIVNNRIYPKSSCFSSTGRVHLYEPSLQNVANDFEVATASGPKTISCRKVFQTCRDNQLISADFCQLELRILTHFSNDRNLTKIMRSDCDVFKTIAAKWNGIDEMNVTDKQRNDTKQICYGIIYGMGVRSLAEKMSCDETDAQEQQDAFLKCYPGIRNFTEDVIRRARKFAYIETVSGRRRYLPDINSIDSGRRSKAERQAVNSTIQGSAADISKLAMLEMDKCLRQRRSTWKNVNLVLHVHDELVYEAPKGMVEDVIRKLKRSMENCFSLNVPLRVKIKSGSDWGTMQVIDS